MINCLLSGTESGWNSEAMAWDLALGRVRRAEAGGSVSLTVTSHASMRSQVWN